MPETSSISAELLSNDEAIRLLKLDQDYPDDPKRATEALHRLKAKGLMPLRGIGPSLKWLRSEIDRFIHAELESQRNDQSSSTARGTK